MSRLLVAFMALAACTTPGPGKVAATTAEASHYVSTGRYEEAVRLCHDFARVYGGVRCEELGATGEGRPIVALHLSRGSGHPTIYVQAGIHAGEIEGKDAGFWFLRDLLDGKVAPGALDVVDMFNAVFERKEYLESYVAEEVARAMLAADPSLRAAFDADLAADPELAKSPRRRLEWFYKRHPAWDERVNLLPTYRVETAPPAHAP